MNGAGFRAWLNAFSEAKACQPLVMGILNYTPDSFSDGQRYYHRDAALARVEAMLEQGADMIDLGAESSRPGATPISAEEELQRLLPLITAIRQRFDVCLSVDTHKPRVMQEVIAAGADWINDINGLGHASSKQIVAQLDVPVCIMHMQGDVSNFGHDMTPEQDMPSKVSRFFSQRLADIKDALIRPEQIVIDPGIGFGKNCAQNLALLRQLEMLKKFNCPILVGVSRKRFIGEILQAKVDQRGVGSLTANLIGYLHGANMIRTHDIKETKQMLVMAQAIMA